MLPDIGSKGIELSQYADDDTAILTDISSAQNLNKLVLFSKYCCLKCNPSKSEAKWLGSFRNSSEQVLISQYQILLWLFIGVNCFFYNAEVARKVNISRIHFISTTKLL